MYLVKTENALRLSRFRHHRHTFTFYLERIPPELLYQLTAFQIAKMVDAMHGIYMSGVADGRAMEG